MVFSPASTNMFQHSIPSLFMAASAVLASSGISPRQNNDVPKLYSSVEAAQEGTTFETDLDEWDSALDTPNMTDFGNLLGFDITKPYGDREESRSYQYHLNMNIIADYPVDSTEDDDPRFTTMTNVWMIVHPDIEADNKTGGPESIDPSWNLCFGYFFFDHDLDPVDDLGDKEEPCWGWLSDREECVNDIEAWLAEEFQANNACPFQEDQASVKLPDSCEKVTDSELVLVRDLGPSSGLTGNNFFGTQSPTTGLSIGTGLNEEGDENAYRTAGLRTMLIAGIWGYNINDTSLESEDPPGAPPVTLSCLRGRRGMASGSALPEEVGDAGSIFSPSPWLSLALPVVVAGIL